MRDTSMPVLPSFVYSIGSSFLSFHLGRSGRPCGQHVHRCSALNDREHQTRRMREIMHNPVDRRLVLIGCFMHDISARVAVTREAWEIAASSSFTNGPYDW